MGGSGDLTGGAGDRKILEIFESQRSRAGKFRQTPKLNKEREQGDGAKGDAVAGSGQGFELERRAIERQSFAQVLFEFGARISRNLDGWKLPHAREEHFIVRAGIAD